MSLVTLPVQPASGLTSLRSGSPVSLTSTVPTTLPVAAGGAATSSSSDTAAGSKPIDYIVLTVSFCSQQFNSRPSNLESLFIPFRGTFEPNAAHNKDAGTAKLFYTPVCSALFKPTKTNTRSCHWRTRLQAASPVLLPCTGACVLPLRRWLAAGKCTALPCCSDEAGVAWHPDGG